jgi:hypothetical protein
MLSFGFLLLGFSISGVLGRVGAFFSKCYGGGSGNTPPPSPSPGYTPLVLVPYWPPKKKPKRTRPHKPYYQNQGNITQSDLHTVDDYEVIIHCRAGSSSDSGVGSFMDNQFIETRV